MTAPSTNWPDSILDAVDTAFAALTSEAAPMSLDLDKLGLTPADDSDLPAGVIALPAVQSWLLKHRRAYTVRDAVWAELIRRARLDGPAWVVAATAMAMPALRRYARQLRTGWSGDAHDLDAEILTGFLTALRDRVDLIRPAPPGRTRRRIPETGQRPAGQGPALSEIDRPCQTGMCSPQLTNPVLRVGHDGLLGQRAPAGSLRDAERTFSPRTGESSC